MAKKKPIGVYAVGVCFILWGGIAFISTLSTLQTVTNPTFTKILLVIMSVCLLIFVMGIGLLMLKEWARIGGAIMMFFNILIALGLNTFSETQSPKQIEKEYAIIMLVSAAILFYLVSYNARRSFKKESV